ncbi:protein-disulfide reductase DsbD family protein [Croceicoccus marinus]|nr:protein-disulfide reductase DsbD domain-containing protein [Croceicoccus marinus]
MTDPCRLNPVHLPSIARGPLRLVAMLWLVVLSLSVAGLAQAQERTNHIAARLVAERAAQPGETIDLAIAMRPEETWHGYWLNPGDAGFGMDLDWDLPPGAEAGTPSYPTPEPLMIGSLMNHVYEGPYAVLVPLKVPADAVPGSRLPVRLKAGWLACTDRICVPEQAELATTIKIAAPGETAPADENFARWRQALPAPVVDSGRYAIEGSELRIAVPLAAGAAIDSPHLFFATDGYVDYAAPQSFERQGDWLIVSTTARKGAAADKPLEMVLRLDPSGTGVSFTARPGEVAAVSGSPSAPQSLLGGAGLALIAAAFAGGLLLNIMPCVFPILSLKALHLARAGGDGGEARREAVAYTLGVVLAVLALGGAMLALRAAGSEIGWAFQLQEPATLVLLLALVAAITANLAGLFEFTLPVRMESSGGGAFMTGLLAAVAATPCTAPFMAAAMGAALLLPPIQALVLFAALGLGLAAPFLAIGFVPFLRRMMPRPGPWMVRFRHIMAIPMALTALALLWLCWRLGGTTLLAGGAAMVVVVLAICWAARLRQRRGLSALAPAMAAVLVALAGSAAASALVSPNAGQGGEMAIPGSIPFSEEALARARTEGPVFLYFTADWCVTCKVNENVAIARDPVIEAFREGSVTVLVGDWTRRDPAITRFLESQGAAGVPLYLWYPRGGDADQLPQVLHSQLLIDRALLPAAKAGL